MTATVVSAIFGNHDNPKRPLRQSVPCNWKMVTDNPRLRARGWDLTVVADDGRHPRLQAKAPKLRPWDHIGGDGPWIWIDGSIEVISPTFVEDVANAAGRLGQWVHPDRDCIYPEADLSATMAKYTATPVIEQAAHYRTLGHPQHWGLWAAGVIVYNDRLDNLADVWSAEIDRWGGQDQISEPVALREIGIRPTDLPHSLYANPWISVHQHRRFT